MSNVPFVTIKPFNIIGSDDRGITADFTLPRQQADFIFLQRQAGSLSGNTYHQGKNTGTNPKAFILISGEIELSYRVVGQREKHLQKISAPAVIEVLPNVVHKVEALTDIIILECNSIQNIQEDRIKEEV